MLTRAGAVPIITALRQAGYDGAIWSQAALGGGVAVAAGEVAEGVLYTVNAAAGSPISTMEEFFTGYEERFDRPATAFAAQGHDALWAVALALESAGCGSRECVQEGLGDLMEEWHRSCTRTHHVRGPGGPRGGDCGQRGRRPGHLVR